MKPKDLIGKRILKIKTSKELGSRRHYISSMDLEEGISILFEPHLNNVGKYVSYFQILGTLRKPKSWAHKILSKALLIIKLKIEDYENKTKTPEEEFFDHAEGRLVDVDYIY